jgi:PAS domain S-box-containing protein
MPTDPIELEKRKLKTIATSLKEAVVILDTSRKISFFNKAAEQMTGFSMFEALGQDADSIIELFDDTQEISSSVYCPEGAIDFEGEIMAKNEVNLIDKMDNVHVVRLSSQKIKEGSLINV